MSTAVGVLSERDRGRTRTLGAARLEASLARVGLALIALHVLDDSFFQPQPGTSAGDHLVSGLVPAAVFLGAAAAYPHLRAGLRASLALSLGLLGIVIGGAEAGYYTLHDRPSGDDYTGFVAVLAGLVLVAVGAVPLWRSRKRDDKLVRRCARRLGIAVAGAIVFAFVIFPLSLSYGFTHAARTTTASGDLGASYGPVSFTTGDGLDLDGWYVPSRNRAAVIVFPGKKGTQKHARMLVRHGYGVLVFDRRGEGESDGDPNALGWAFDRDLKGAIGFLQRRRDVDRNRIGGLGLSVGGEALLQTAAETDTLGAVVSEGAGARSVREDMIGMHASKVPEVASSAVLTAGTALFANQAPPASLEKLAGKITSPVFYVYASHGAAGEDKNPNYYRATRGPKQIWKIDTSHTHGLSARPDEYERRVVGFFDKTLLQR
jgi:dienelactone hydrolase